jgi:hypothetical protein
MIATALKRGLIWGLMLAPYAVIGLIIGEMIVRGS